MVEAPKAVSQAKKGTGVDNRERRYSRKSFSCGNGDKP